MIGQSQTKTADTASWGCLHVTMPFLGVGPGDEAKQHE